MLANEDKTRESIIAILLVVFCFISLILGLYLFQKNSLNKNNKDANIVSPLLRDRVAVIGLEGLIYDAFSTKRNPFSNNLDIASTKKELKKAMDDSHVKAVLLRVNSPGGTVAASQEVYKMVKALREKKKPVVVSMGDVCASGCYYIASAADKIVANPGTLTGSIGVISQGVNITGLLGKLGIVNQTFKAGKYKDIGSSQRLMSEEEKQLLQELLNNSYQQFLGDVETGRSIERERLESIAQGLIYTGEQALDVGLVDTIGTYDDSKQVVKTVLEEDYGYTKASSISFDETWVSNKLSSFEEIFDFGFSDALSLFGFRVNNSSSVFDKSRELSVSKYQPLWLMP